MARTYAQYGAYLLGLLLFSGALLINLIMHNAYETKALFFLFVLCTAAVASTGSAMPAFFTGSLSTLAVLYFFVEPLHTLRVHHDDEWFKLLVFALHVVPAMLTARFISIRVRKTCIPTTPPSNPETWRFNGKGQSQG